MVRHPHAQHRRQAKRAREAEGMEERQHAHKAVGPVQAKDLFELLDVRADVVVAQHHALRIARAAAGENDRRQVVQRGFLLASQRALQPANRQQPRAEQRAKLLAGARFSRHLLQEDSLAGHFELHLVEEGPGGQHGLDAALADAGGQRFLGHGVVQVHRHFAHEQRREIHQRARHRRRQQQADHLLARPDFPQPPRQEDRPHERGTEAHFGGWRIGHRKAERMAAGRPHERAVQRFHVRFAMLPRLGHEFLHALPHLERRRRMRQRLAEVHRHAIGNPARQLPEEAPLLEAEDAAPHAVQRHGDDRRLHVLHDALEAAPERQQVADARDLAFGEDADHFAVLDGLAGRAQRLEHLARAQLGGNGNGAQDAGKGLYPGLLVNALVHDEAHVPVGGGQQQQRVHQREVVADEERAAFGGDVVPAIHPDAIDRVREQPQTRTAARNPAGARRRKRSPPASSARRSTKTPRGPRCSPTANDPIERPRPRTCPPRRANWPPPASTPFCSLGGRCWRIAEIGHDEEAAEEAQRGDDRQDLAER